MVSRRTRLWRWWHRSATSLGIIGLLGVGAFLALVIYAQQSREELAIPGAGLIVFFLIPLNVIILCILGLIIGRNIVKLIFDRRRNILGAKLRTRLVVAFVGLILIPTSLLFWLASGLLNRALEGWFSTQVEAAVDGAINVARLHYNQRKELISNMSDRILRQLQNRAELFSDSEQSKSSLKRFVDGARTERGLFSVRLQNSNGEIVVESRSVADEVDILKAPEPDQKAIESALAGTLSVFPQETTSGHFIRSYSPLNVNNQNFVLIVTYRTEPDLTHASDQVKASFMEYQQLKLYKSPLKSGYLLTFSMVTGLILFGAIWFAFFLARQMVEPVQRLAEGTRQVALGNLDFKIKAGGDDEVGVLIDSFNGMTADLRQSRVQAEEHRLYLETILTNLAVGVIALNEAGEILAINVAALKILGEVDSDERADSQSEIAMKFIGRSLNKLIAGEQYKTISELLAELNKSLADSDNPNNFSLERDLLLTARGRSLRIICTVGRVPAAVEQRGEVTIVLLDNITELAKAQQLAAWREVARRIAHEIKNPLTPIQLAAQRMGRLLGGGPDAELVRECTNVIVENVDSIKRLADEFSKFSRMPSAELQLCDLNQLASETVAPFAEHSSSITFQFVAARGMPAVLIDREQIRRVLINLIDNAVAAISAQTASGRSAVPGRIVVRTNYDPGLQVVSLEVIDNGPGVADSDKGRIFEPYFTTTKGGTGLGLAISAAIVADHQGEIRLYDNVRQEGQQRSGASGEVGRGARFVVELPISPKASTHRRLAGGNEGLT